MLRPAVPNRVLPSIKLMLPVGCVVVETTVEVKVTALCSMLVFTLEVSVMPGAPLAALPLSGSKAVIPPSAVMLMMPVRNPLPVGVKLTGALTPGSRRTGVLTGQFDARRSVLTDPSELPRRHAALGE